MRPSNWFLLRRYAKRAPGVLVLVITIFSFLLAAWSRPPVGMLFILLLALLFLSISGCFLRRRHGWLCDLVVVLLLVCSAMLTFGVYAEFPVADPSMALHFGHVAVVESDPVQEKGRTVLTVRLVEEASGSLLPLRAKVFIELPAPRIDYGDVVVIRGRLRIPDGVRNPGGFDYRSYLHRKQIHYTMHVSGQEVYAIAHCNLNPFFRYVLFPVRRYCTDVIRERLDMPHSSLLMGLTIGQRGDIPAEIYELFADAGVIHILAVSGLHVGILSLFLLMVFRSLRIRFAPATGITCACILVYVFIVDLRAPVLRAALMFMFIMFGLLMQRRILLLNIIACSAALILIFRPQDIHDPGFQLSFAATFAIVLFHEHIANWFPRWLRRKPVVRNFFVIPFAISLSAQLGTAPIVAFHFFRYPVIAPVSNIIMIPFVFVAIPTGFMMVAGNLLHPAIARVLGAASWFFLHCIIQFSIFCKQLPHASMWVRRPGVLFFILYYAILLAVMVVRGRRRMVAVTVLSLVALNAVMLCRLMSAVNPLMKVHFLDVAQGDAMVIEFPDNEVMVIDGGKRNAFSDYGERVILPFLRSKGIGRISAIVATHPDIDHYGGLISLIEKLQVGYLLVNGDSKESNLYQEFLIKAKERGIPIYTLRRGQVVWVGNTPLYVLHPPPSAPGVEFSSNERSLVLKCGYGATSFLFTGDYPNDVLRIPAGALASQVLKFPHHGAYLKNGSGFLDQVSPSITVLSVGRMNSFGHPHPTSITLLRSSGSIVYRTDRHGAVTVYTDGERTVTRTALPSP